MTRTTTGGPVACRSAPSCSVLAWLVVFLLASAAPDARAFDLNDVARRAQALAQKSYAKPPDDLPKELRQLTYDQYQDIRFRRDRTPWRNQGLAFDLSFFHRGMIYQPPVRINEVVGERVGEFRYRADDFDFGNNRIPADAVKGAGFAGFRVLYPINRPKNRDEIVVFLGASYLRAVGRGQTYGLSARGLAIDTAEPSGEEFPRFVEFWIERPAPDARQLVIYALLDSPRATGAYRFVVRPGEATTTEVHARLYLRDKVAKLGLAPLTSMFLFGANQPADHPDYRPAVHDSDGLSLNTGNGEWLWRPLLNPKRLLVTSFATTDPRGFGLLQRDRRPGSYEAPGMYYEKRPGAWVEPLGKWGPGRVELVQIPSPDETNDNIVAYWVPERQPAPRVPYDLRYRIAWQNDSEHPPPLYRVLQTRRGPENPTVGHEAKGGGPAAAESIGLRIDFSGSGLSPALRAAAVKASVQIDGNAELLRSTLEANEALDGWRLFLQLRRQDASKPVELRSTLVGAKGPLSETWSYILPPD